MFGNWNTYNKLFVVVSEQDSLPQLSCAYLAEPRTEHIDGVKGIIT